MIWPTLASKTVASASFGFGGRYFFSLSPISVVAMVNKWSDRLRERG